MSYDKTFRFAELPSTQADIMHWRVRAKYRKGWHKRVAEQVMVLRARPAEPLESATVECWRHSSGKSIDADNLRYSFKVVIDGLVRAGVLADDKPDVIGEPAIHHQPAKPKMGFIEIRVSSP